MNYCGRLAAAHQSIENDAAFFTEGSRAQFLNSALCNPLSLALFQHTYDHSSRHDRRYRVCADKPRAFKIADDAQKLKVSVEHLDASRSFR
jgi:hypothetical protein